MKQLIERLNRLGLSQAAQIVERYAALAAELHAARQRIVALEGENRRLEAYVPKPAPTIPPNNVHCWKCGREYDSNALEGNVRMSSGDFCSDDCAGVKK